MAYFETFISEKGILRKPPRKRRLKWRSATLVLLQSDKGGGFQQRFYHERNVFPGYVGGRDLLWQAVRTLENGHWLMITL